MTTNDAKTAILNEMALKRLQMLDERLSNLVDIQNADGNWNYSPYMMGLANGLILARAVIRNESPAYRNHPQRWLEDIPRTPLPVLGMTVEHQPDQEKGVDQ